MHLVYHFILYYGIGHAEIVIRVNQGSELACSGEFRYVACDSGSFIGPTRADAPNEHGLAKHPQLYPEVACCHTRQIYFSCIISIQQYTQSNNQEDTL